MADPALGRLWVDGLWVEGFAVDAGGCQLVWRALPAGPGPDRFGPRQITVGERTVEVVGDDRTGSVWVDGLPPDTDLPISVNGRPAGTVRTRPALAGPVLARVATISDLHVGQEAVGRFPRLGGPPNLRCLEAAVAEIVEWGADLLVLKGDATEGGKATEWEAVATVLEATGIPVVVTLGNHDAREPDRIDPRGLLAGAGLALTPAAGVEVVDLPGVRVVVGDTTTPDRNIGTFRHIGADIVAAADGASGAVLLAVHHHLQPLPVPHHWPPGIPSPEARRFAARLDRAGRPTIVTSGHTHRHRSRRYGQVWATEVGSVKDYPGVWASYEAHEGGLRQVVRRVAASDVLGWTDRTAATALGLWRRWSPGRIEHRCLEVGS